MKSLVGARGSLRALAASERASMAAYRDHLSEREEEVLRLITAGNSNQKNRVMGTARGLIAIDDNQSPEPLHDGIRWLAY